MALTLAYLSALDVTRILRSSGLNLHNMDAIPLVDPTPWVGKHWSLGDFASTYWRWTSPSRDNHMHVLAPKRQRQILLPNIDVHTVWRNLPPRSILWLDEHSSMVGPELLFLQMAETLEMPKLVMLGYELCGHFSRTAGNPLNGYVVTGIPAATSVDDIQAHLAMSPRVPGVGKARRALQFVADHAISAPEAVLATVYSLPTLESGYGMGPITLNERVPVDGPESESDDFAARAKARYPDISFSFAPIGINYDGSDHFDLDGLITCARNAALASSDTATLANQTLQETKEALRSKIVDDMRRNRQLAASGRIVFPATKEDLYEWAGLDELTWQILECARVVFGTDVRNYQRVLNDTERQRDRRLLIKSLLPSGESTSNMHGKM